MAGPLTNSKHELVIQAIFSGATLAEAASAGGFTGKWPESHACNIAKRPEVRQRLEELHKLAADEKIMTVLQRKIVLSEIARADLKDYYTNGVLNPLDKDVPNPSAIERVEYGYDPIHKKAYPAKVWLRDPVRAIHELCLMEGVYKAGVNLNVNVESITNVSVVDARERLIQHINRLSVRTGSDIDTPEDNEETHEPSNSLVPTELSMEPSIPLLEPSTSLREQRKK